MKEKVYSRILAPSIKAFVKVSAIVWMILSFENTNAQQKVSLEWDYTYASGLSCKYPMIIRIYYSASDGSNYDFAIFKHSSQTSTGSYPDHTSQRSYYFTLPAGATLSTLRIAAGYKNDEGKCPSMPSSGICYTDGVYNITQSTNYCEWPETAPVICGLSNFKVAVNIAPSSGTPVIQQGTPKAAYCPGETITFEVPCNMKGRGWTFRWYYKEGTGFQKFLKTTTSETLTVGAGGDLTPTPGVNTYLYVTGMYNLTSEYSGSFRYGAAPPTGTIDPRPPTCADGPDWSININNVTSSSATVTSFKANIFLESNPAPQTTPDGSIAFSGASGTITASDIISGRTSVPGTKFRITLQNDFDPTTDGVCSTDLGWYTIPNKPKLTATEITSGHKNLTCYNVLTGELQLNVSNGDGAYTLKLNGTVHAVKPGSPTHQPVIEKLDGGSYTVIVTDTNCESDPITIALTEPTELSASIDIVKGLDCSYSSDGQLKVNITGGIAPYSTAWSNGNTSVTAIGLAEGTHTVTVTDQGCPSITRSQLLDAPEPMVTELAETLPKCPGGTDGSMGISNLQNAPGTIDYLWNTGESSSEIFGLSKGTYSVSVTSTDAGKTCVGNASLMLDDPSAWTATIKPALTHHGKAISCNGKRDGRLDVIVKNDVGQEVTGEYYTWSTGDNGASKTFIDQLAEDTYGITVQYNGVCEAESSYVLFDPEPVTASIIPNVDYYGQLISCHNASDASVSAIAAGGTGPFSYKWNTGWTESTLSGVGAGEYDITVWDLNGCQAKDTILIENPDPVEASILSSSDYSGFGVSCAGKNDGFITGSGSGGTDFFSYSWSNGTTAAFNDKLTAGSYTLTVSDENSCQATISHIVTTPVLLTLQVDSLRNISCFDGSDGYIVLQPVGGSSEYEYSIDSAVWQLSPTFGSLQTGTYRLHVRDGNGCFNAVNESLSQPPVINIDFTDIEPAYCSNPIGKATGIVTGGVGNYQYEWKPGGETASLSTDATLSNVAAGLYDLFVRDGNGCPAVNSVAITSTDGAKTVYSSTDAKCFDASDGSALITITEGDGPFTIQWPDGQNSLQGTNLKSGSYNVLITDGHDCTIIQTVTVAAPDPLQLVVKDETIPTCHTFCDGQLTLEALGGAGGYLYEWNGKTGPQQTELCAAIYPVILKDANNCTITAEVELKQPAAIAVTSVNETLPTCKDGCDGALEIIASGGNGGYQYTWDGGGDTPIKNNICPGAYNVTINDQKGCTGAATLVLNNTPALPLDLGGGVTLCVGQTYTLDAGAGWTSTAWKSSSGFNSTDTKVLIKDPGAYWLEAFNQDGCVANDTFLLETSFDLLKANFILSSQAYAEDTVVIIDVSWPLPENTEWNYPLAMNELQSAGDVMYGQFSDPGEYQISLTAHLGECVDQMTKTITILSGDQETEGGRLGYEDFVKDFTLYPNPNDGNFDVGVELAEESYIILSVWNTLTSRMVGKFGDDGKKSYQKNINLSPLSSGTYLLRLDHARGKEYIRFIVH